MRSRRGRIVGLIVGVLIALSAAIFLTNTGIRVDELGTSPTLVEQFLGWGSLLIGTVLALASVIKVLVSNEDTPTGS
ncbi:hypothetical protein [Cryobacterium ruanii]|jgi:hypothetical protein|uniref:Uncharacterized protein n=1 Tax=Cryobacterium ruanii TaxID=1259197 RepID=A0A4R9AN99_9MICO|nr:hypothetical protein [Cryobacterium ruanii]TFD66305.1 hypothetical protein E3T47_07285 [Cryobacterium ruanii]